MSEEKQENIGSAKLKLGGRIEVWQKNLISPDNLITLNDGVDKELPYAGIEVKRGSDKSPVYFLFAEDNENWTTVKDGNRRDLAFKGDPVSNFEWDLKTSEVFEEEEFFTKTKAGQAVRSGKGIEIKHTKEGATVHQKTHTSTHNFWVSNKVSRTRGTDKEILPAFISSCDHEKKTASKLRCRLSNGSAEVFLKKNDEIVSDPTVAKQSAKEQNIDEPLKDGDVIGVSIGETKNARNLSVSVTIETSFS